MTCFSDNTKCPSTLARCPRTLARLRFLDIYHFQDKGCAGEKRGGIGGHRFWKGHTCGQGAGIVVTADFAFHVSGSLFLYPVSSSTVTVDRVDSGRPVQVMNMEQMGTSSQIVY